MKNRLIIFFSAFLCLTAVPAGLLSSGNAVEVNSNITPKADTSENALSSEASTNNTLSETDDKSITVFLSAREQTVSVSYFEYTCGSTAAEMPVTYEDEALKAQAVACFTNALRLKNANTKNEELAGADISDNTAVHQGYLSLDERREKWGEDFEKYEEKLENAVNCVLNKALTYKGELCTAAFCAISPGATESAENMWGSKVPYLVSVKSSGDTLSPDYSSTSRYSREQVAKALESLNIALKDGDMLEELIKIEKTSRAGTVLSVKIGTEHFSGEEVRNAFSLRSAAFTVKASKNALTFTVLGYGHGVGLSQYGANYMAKNGSDFEEILKHYYKGAQISDL